MYRIVARETANGSLETIAILLPTSTTNPTGDEAIRYLQDHVVNIETLEGLTGFHFLPNAAAKQQSVALWKFDGMSPNSLCHDTAREQP